MQRVQYYSLTDQVYTALKRDILQRKVLPNEKLDVTGLAQQLGVSRMPVVDALTRLESEGLVEKRNRVGTFVTPMNQTMFRERFETRGMIEDWAAPRIIAQASDDDFGRIAQLLNEAHAVLQKADEEGFDLLTFNTNYDTGFHQSLIRLADNAYVSELYSAIQTRIGLSFVDMPVKRETSAQRFHERILAAFQARDVAEAIKTQKDHREESLAFTLKRMKERDIL